MKISDANAKSRMKLHPKVSIITNLFGSSVGLLGISLAISVPAMVASIASYITLSLYFDLEQSRQKIRDLAITDDLTKILNRRYFLN